MMYLLYLYVMFGDSLANEQDPQTAEHAEECKKSSPSCETNLICSLRYIVFLK